MITIIGELLLEANLHPLRVYFEAQCANAAEKAKRMSLNDPMYKLVTSKAPPTRLLKTKQSFQHVSIDIFNEMKWREGRVNDNGNEIFGVGVILQEN